MYNGNPLPNYTTHLHTAWHEIQQSLTTPPCTPINGPWRCGMRTLSIDRRVQCETSFVQPAMHPPLLTRADTHAHTRADAFHHARDHSLTHFVLYRSAFFKAPFIMTILYILSVYVKSATNMFPKSFPQFPLPVRTFRAPNTSLNRQHSHVCARGFASNRES